MHRVVCPDDPNISVIISLGLIYIVKNVVWFCFLIPNDCPLAVWSVDGFSLDGYTHLVYEGEHWHGDVHFHFPHNRSNCPSHLLPQSPQLMRWKLPVPQDAP